MTLHQTTSNYHFEGRLRDVTVAEVLGKVCRLPGAGEITAAQDGITCSILTRAGLVCGASSSDPAQRLGVHLRNQKLLSTGDLERIRLQLETSGSPLGSLLIEHGLLSPLAVREGLRSQVGAIIRDSMSWSEGTVSFEIGEWKEPPPIHIEVPIRETVMRSLGPAEELEGLLGRLGGPDAVLEASYTLDELVDLGLDEREYALLSLVDGRLSLAQLSAHGPLPGRGNERLLLAFFALQLVVSSGEKPTRFPRIASSRPVDGKAAGDLPATRGLERQLEDSSHATFETLRAQAMTLYLERDYTQALELLSRCRELRPEDKGIQQNVDKILKKVKG